MKKGLIIGIAVILAAVSAVTIVAVAGRNEGTENRVVYTPDPVSGELPSVSAVEYAAPSFFEYFEDAAGKETVDKADIVLLFSTYAEIDGIMYAESAYHGYHIVSAPGKSYTFEFADMSSMYSYESKGRWAEDGICDFIYQDISHITEKPDVLNVYKDGNLFDTILLHIKDAEDGEGHICKMLVAAESEKLNVAYYNVAYYNEARWFTE